MKYSQKHEVTDAIGNRIIYTCSKESGHKPLIYRKTIFEFQ